MIRFIKKQLLEMHADVIAKSGGTYGILNESALDAAIGSVYQTFGGQELFPTIEEKAARLGFGLIKNHSFIDGNKRIGLLAMLSLLEANNVALSFDDNDIEKLILAVAAGGAGYDELLAWIRGHEGIS